MEDINDILSTELSGEFLYYVIAAFVLRIIIWLFFGNTIRKTLLLMKPENRFMKPFQALLVAIPLFNIYWNFEVVKNLSNSIHNEAFDRQLPIEERPLMKPGMLYAWTFLAINIPFPVGILLMGTIMQFIFFISYWVKIAQFKSLLQEHDIFLRNQENKQNDENI